MLQVLELSTQVLDNAVYGKVGRAASEECVLALLQAKCLPILLYGTEALSLIHISEPTRPY